MSFTCCGTPVSAVLLPEGPTYICCREVPAGASDAGAAATTNKLLCDEECLAKVDSLQTQETKSGLKYKDIVVGTGPSPPTGYQVNLAGSSPAAKALKKEQGHSWRQVLLPLPRSHIHLQPHHQQPNSGCRLCCQRWQVYVPGRMLCTMHPCPAWS